MIFKGLSTLVVNKGYLGQEYVGGLHYGGSYIQCIKMEDRTGLWLVDICNTSFISFIPIAILFLASSQIRS